MWSARASHDRKIGDRKVSALDSHFPVIYLPVIFGCRADGAPARSRLRDVWQEN